MVQQDQVLPLHNQLLAYATRKGVNIEVTGKPAADDERHSISDAGRPAPCGAGPFLRNLRHAQAQGRCQMARSATTSIPAPPILVEMTSRNPTMLIFILRRLSGPSS